MRRSTQLADHAQRPAIGEGTLVSLQNCFDAPDVHRFTMSDRVEAIACSQRRRQTVYIADGRLLQAHHRLSALQNEAVITAYKPAAQGEQQQAA